MIGTYFVGIILGLIVLFMIVSVINFLMYLASKDLENYWLELDEKFLKRNDKND